MSGSLKTTKGLCFCGQLYTCDDCGGDVCACTCDIDGAPQRQSEVTSGYVNPSTARMLAWAEKIEAKR